jgi:hypothetical protein
MRGNGMPAGGVDFIHGTGKPVIQAVVVENQPENQRLDIYPFQGDIKPAFLVAAGNNPFGRAGFKVSSCVTFARWGLGCVR